MSQANFIVNHILANKKKNPKEVRKYHVICIPDKNITFERVFERAGVWKGMRMSTISSSFSSSFLLLMLQT
jgi:hypothetical protein